jgi:hypothetical protein
VCPARQRRGSAGERTWNKVACVLFGSVGVRDLWLLAVIGLKIASKEGVQIDATVTQLPAFIPLVALPEFPSDSHWTLLNTARCFVQASTARDPSNLRSVGHPRGETRV